MIISMSMVTRVIGAAICSSSRTYRCVSASKTIWTHAAFEVELEKEVSLSLYLSCKASSPSIGRPRRRPERGWLADHYLLSAEVTASVPCLIAFLPSPSSLILFVM